MKKLMVLMMTGLLVGAWYTTFTSEWKNRWNIKKNVSSRLRKMKKKEFIRCNPGI